MEAFVICLFLAAFVLASTALSWWGGYQMGCEEGTAPSVNDRGGPLQGQPPSLDPDRYITGVRASLSSWW